MCKKKHLKANKTLPPLPSHITYTEYLSDLIVYKEINKKR